MGLDPMAKILSIHPKVTKDRIKSKGCNGGFEVCSGRHGRKSNPSAAAIADLYLLALDDDRHFALSLGDFEHFLQFVGV
jgi:hypothetical protein